jgi:hypothetical protein
LLVGDDVDAPLQTTFEGPIGAGRADILTDPAAVAFLKRNDRVSVAVKGNRPKGAVVNTSATTTQLLESDTELRIYHRFTNPLLSGIEGSERAGRTILYAEHAEIAKAAAAGLKQGLVGGGKDSVLIRITLGSSIRPGSGDVEVELRTAHVDDAILHSAGLDNTARTSATASITANAGADETLFVLGSRWSEQC